MYRNPALDNNNTVKVVLVQSPAKPKVKIITEIKPKFLAMVKILKCFWRRFLVNLLKSFL